MRRRRLQHHRRRHRSHKRCLYRLHRCRVDLRSQSAGSYRACRWCCRRRYLPTAGLCPPLPQLHPRLRHRRHRCPRCYLWCRHRYPGTPSYPAGRHRPCLKHHHRHRRGPRYYQCRHHRYQPIQSYQMGKHRQIQLALQIPHTSPRISTRTYKIFRLAPQNSGASSQRLGQLQSIRWLPRKS